MKLVYCPIKGGNFGDDLNQWLWPKVFHGYPWPNEESTAFVGIGTILKLPAPTSSKKIVFGSGIWLPDQVPTIDETWDVRFLRGPVSQRYVADGSLPFISDAAMAVALVKLPSVERRPTIGFMPHYVTSQVVDCERLCELARLQYIDPQWPTQKTIDALRSCDRVITEAMHGAIVADAFRVPWCRISILCHKVAGPMAHSLKWLDWGMSLGVDVSSEEAFELPRKTHRLPMLPLYWAERHFRAERLLTGLRKLRDSRKYCLSQDSQLSQVVSRLREEIDRMDTEYSTKQEL